MRRYISRAKENIMRVIFICILAVNGAWGEDDAGTNRVVASDTSQDSSDAELMQAFVIFRHGDRTPDQEELALYPSASKGNSDIFFPYGMKALTNKGKQRGFYVGKYLRKRYDNFVSPLYLTDEVVVRTTSYSRTKMTALTALAALYPPPPAQMWNPELNWQPVPYNAPELERDDLMYWYNCDRYIKLRNTVYSYPEVAERLKPYEELFNYLQEHTGRNITTPEDVFYLDNLFQTLQNVGLEPPDWAVKVMPKIKEITKLEYACELYTPTLIKLASGVLLEEILNATSNFIAGDSEQPKLRLYSAHENNVAALMAASRTFVPHQPSYGATYILELWRMKTGQYSILAVYAKDAGGPGQIMDIKGCGTDYCDYDKFVTLVKEYAWSKSDFYQECKIKVNDDC